MVAPKGLWSAMGTLKNAQEISESDNPKEFGENLTENNVRQLIYASIVFAVVSISDGGFSFDYVSRFFIRISNCSATKVKPIDDEQEIDSNAVSEESELKNDGLLASRVISLVSLLFGSYTSLAFSAIAFDAMRPFGLATQATVFVPTFLNYLAKRHETIEQLINDKYHANRKVATKKNFLQKYQEITLSHHLQGIVTTVGFLMAISSGIAMFFSFVPSTVKGIEFLTQLEIGRSTNYKNAASLAVGFPGTLITAIFYFIHNFYAPKMVAHSLEYCIHKLRDPNTTNSWPYYKHLLLTGISGLISYWFGVGFKAVVDIMLNRGSYQYLSNFSHALPMMTLFATIGSTWAHFQYKALAWLHNDENNPTENCFKWPIVFYSAKQVTGAEQSSTSNQVTPI
jgi:hypothetical protein